MDVVSSRWWVQRAWNLVCLGIVGFCAVTVNGQDAQWIWTSAHEPGMVPTGPSHYRKNFTLENPEIGELVIAADDDFQVYCNGRLIGYGAGYDEMTRIDLTPALRSGDNALAIRATNTAGGSAALVAIARFRVAGDPDWRWLATDISWKSATQVTPQWTMRTYDDSGWIRVRELGKFGTTAPWDNYRLQARQLARGLAPRTAGASQANPAQSGSAVAGNTSLASSNNGASTPATLASAESRTKSFTVPPNFSVTRVVDGSVGSLLAMEFNEFGQLVLSREGGKLLLVDLSQAAEGSLDVRKYCDSLESVQGILPLNGSLYVTGFGPDGMALYRLEDADRDGMMEPVATLVKFSGEPGEHGPHGLALGPDGMIYVMIGNASGVEGGTSDRSLVRHFHEGDLISRLNDPGGHAQGIRAPGGTVVRVSLDGKHKEVVCAGIRNAYDLAFNRQGRLFFHDSDMESDVGMPWYRPTRVCEAAPGAEFGWRSGSAKFRDYYLDSVPAIVDTGRGSPTGLAFYDHVMMPVRYQGSLFLGDWSSGRILNMQLEATESGWRADTEEFLTATPLSVTDMAVGPDGALWFCTGGRGTEGGVYRVSWNGTVPSEIAVQDKQRDIVLKTRQPFSAWSRQKLAEVRTDMGTEAWAALLKGALADTNGDATERARALEIMHLYGPRPSDTSLTMWLRDAAAPVRRTAAWMAGFRNDDATATELKSLLSDSERDVRIAACAALIRRNATVGFDQVRTMLASREATESAVARRLLESMSVETWKANALAESDLRGLLNSCAALMIAAPELSNAYQVLARISERESAIQSEAEVLDMLRVCQLALERGRVNPAEIPLFHERILARFPAASGSVNRELSKVLAYLKVAEVLDRLPDYLENSTDSDADKIQVIAHLRGLAAETDSPTSLACIGFLENWLTRNDSGMEGNHDLYIAQIVEPWAANIEAGDVDEILARGAEWPTATLAAFFLLPEKLTEAQAEAIVEIDRQLKGRTETTAQRTRLACLALLGRSGDAISTAYLREVWRHEQARRNDAALALSQQPDGENWPYLLNSLDGASDDTTAEILEQLAGVDKRPKEPVYVRHTILAGYRLRDQGAASANRVLEHWTGMKVDASGIDWKTTMQAWAKWYNDTYPSEEPVTFLDATTKGRYSVDAILSQLESDPTPPRIHNGQLVFQKAQCASCHRFQGQGEALGPDLTTIANRFSQRELIASILHPSKVISDQYAGKKLLLVDGRQLDGVLTQTGQQYVLLKSDGSKVTLDVDEVEEILPMETSVMPEGLLDPLTPEEIRDLTGFLYQQQ